MKAVALLLFVTLVPCTLLAEEHRLIAASEWSESVVSNDRSLRARVLIMEGRSRAYAGPGTEVLLYVEIENTNGAWGEPLNVYFDAAQGLNFEIFDGDDRPVPAAPTAGSGGDVATCWTTIPYDSSIRLRANPGGWGNGDESVVNLPLRPLQGQHWRLRPDQEYYLTGTLTIAPPTENDIAHRNDWRGTLSFPKTKISARE